MIVSPQGESPQGGLSQGGPRQGRVSHGQVLRVLLVDDQPQFRRAAAMLINATDGLALVGEAGSGEEAVGLASTLAPDLVLMDVRLPGIDGPEATRQILTERPVTRVILMSTYEAADLPDLEHCGAARFLRKQDLDARALLG